MAYMAITKILGTIAFIILIASILGSSSLPQVDQTERVRAFTRNIEFDYISWTLNALGVKLSQSTLDSVHYLPDRERRQIVKEYLALVVSIQQNEHQLGLIFADPGISDPELASQELRQELDKLYSQRDELGPLAESIMQSQLSLVLADLGLTLGGQPLPPVLYHSTPLPLALIVSPRNVIRQEENISLIATLTVDEQVALEEQVDNSLDVSSLVVGIGGIGVYPTMVMQSSDLNWLSEVVAHEWVHNYLTFRPLGLNYFETPELRTMNETSASIAGKEIGQALVERYYPELLPPPPPDAPPPNSSQSPEPEVPIFDFRAEMRETRVTVDDLLVQGKIEEAEQYMEARRAVFWENGYRIRKINQAYFAFYGAYADQPGGAAGEDPVGSAVRALRSMSPDLKTFLKRISWISSFEELQEAVQGQE